jgi:hypothetical protein
MKPRRESKPEELLESASLPAIGGRFGVALTVGSTAISSFRRRVEAVS